MLEEEEFELLVYHEVGHAVAAMHFGGEGWINILIAVDDPSEQGSCQVRNGAMPTEGLPNVIWSYAGVVAEILSLDEFIERPEDVDPDGVWSLVWGVWGLNAVDLAGIGSLEETQEECAECARILLSRWTQVEDMARQIIEIGQVPQAHYFHVDHPFLALAPT